MAQRGKGRGANMAFAGDYIALGAKGASGSKRVVGSADTSAQSSSSSGGGVGSSGAGSMAHKAKQGRGGGGLSSSSWENAAAESVDASDLVRAITEEEGGAERAPALLCGAVRALRSQRAKPDQLLYLSLLVLAKTEPHLFLAHEHVVEAFCSLLKRDAKVWSY